jgi:hypothetical protein
MVQLFFHVLVNLRRVPILKDYKRFLQQCLLKATGQNLEIDILIRTKG